MKWGKLVELKKLRIKKKLNSLSASGELRLLKLEQEKIDLNGLIPDYWNIEKLKKLRNEKT